MARIPPQSFAAQFRAMRKMSGQSLRWTAKRAGISASFLTDIEHNRRMPSRRHIQKLAEAVGRSAAELLRHDHRESVEEMLVCLAEHPEATPSLAKICRRLEAGQLDLSTLERFASDASGTRGS